MAHKIVGGEEDKSESVEAVFVQPRDPEASAEELLVDNGWKLVEIEPEAVEVNSLPRTRYGGNGINGIGPSVEMVLGNGHHANGGRPRACLGQRHGHHDEAEEPQQTLFSWAEHWVV